MSERRSLTRDQLAALRSRISQGIQLLEAGESEAYLLAMAPPEGLKHATETAGGMNEAVRDFKQSGKEQALLRALRYALEQEPTVKMGSTVVEYQLPQNPMAPQVGPSLLRFRLIDGSWYLQ